jgi:hypothetical protein
MSSPKSLQLPILGGLGLLTLLSIWQIVRLGALEEALETQKAEQKAQALHAPAPAPAFASSGSAGRTDPGGGPAGSVKGPAGSIKGAAVPPPNWKPPADGDSADPPSGENPVLPPEHQGAPAFDPNGVEVPPTPGAPPSEPPTPSALPSDDPTQGKFPVFDPAAAPPPVPVGAHMPQAGVLAGNPKKCPAACEAMAVCAMGKGGCPGAAGTGKAFFKSVCKDPCLEQKGMAEALLAAKTCTARLTVARDRIAPFIALCSDLDPERKP